MELKMRMYEDFEEIDLEEVYVEDIEEAMDNQCGCSRGCDDCLGMSWRDFY